MTKGFTLIELLVVMALVGLLAAIVLISLEGAREDALTGKGLQFSGTLENSLGAYLGGEWSFDDDTALDRSGNGNDGTINGAIAVDGLVSRAMSFDGSNYILVNDASELKPAAITVELWAKPLAMSSSYQTVLAKYTWWGPYSIIWETYNKTCANVGFSGSQSYLTAQRVWSPGTEVCINQWSHLVLTCGSDGLYGYINGELLASDQTACSINSTDTNPLYIGMQQGGHYFNGIIDEVRVYQEALTEQAVEERYLAGLDTHRDLVKR